MRSGQSDFLAQRAAATGSWPSSGLSFGSRNAGQPGERRQQVDRAGDLRDRACPAGCGRASGSSSGERTPPSSVEPLRPFMPPFQRQLLGPLSLK